MRFKRTTKFAPCVICGKDDCKITDDGQLHLCRREPTDRALEKYRSTGRSKDISQLWEIWVLKADGWVGDSERKAPTRSELPESKTFPSPLTAEQRDNQYRKLYSMFGLSHEHKKQLKQERGLTDEAINLIAQHQLLTSWAKNERLNNFTFSDKLPAIKSTADGVVTGGKNGLAIPAIDLDGNILGQQIRPDSKAERENAKYVWDTAYSIDGTGYQAKLNDGSHEWPLAHWVYPGKDFTDSAITEVWYCEGFLKSLIVAATLWSWYKRTDILVVGAAAGSYGDRQIGAIISRYSNATHLLLPDSGAIQNLAVLRQYRALNTSLGKRDRDLQIAWWDQYEKCKGIESGTDVDEMIVNSTSLDFLSGRITRSEMFSLLEEYEIHQAEQYQQNQESYLNSFDTYVAATGDKEITREEWVERFSVDTDVAATTANKTEPKSPYQYWGYLKGKFKGMITSTLEYSRSLGNKWGELHESLPEMGERDIPPQSVGVGNDNTIYYSEGDRLPLWKDLVLAKARYIFDRSTMGLGKSYDAGLLEPESLGVDKLIYIAAEHRNITTPTLESWVDLVPRHNGLVKDELGKLRRRTAQSVALGEPWAVKPNCARTGLLALLRDRNIESADAASVICQSCPHFEGCSSGSGEYTYLRDRGDVLRKSRFRCHPASLPPIDQFDYSPNPDKMRKHKNVRDDGHGNLVSESPIRGTGLIWEEWSQILTDSKTVKANVGDVHQLAGYLMNVNPELASRIQPITSALASLMDVNSGKQPKYGWPHEMIVKRLKGAIGIPQSEWQSLFSDLIIELDKWTNPDSTGAIDSLFAIGDEIDGVNVADLPKSVRARLGKTEAELITQASATILKQWLPEFLGVISGLDVGLVNIRFDQLSITTCDKHLIHIARSAAFNIFLDATEMPSNLAAILGVNTSEITTVAQGTEPSYNHMTIQVTDVGRLGSDRGKEQTRRKNEVLRELIKSHPDLAVIDWKKFISPDLGDELGCHQYAWWRDSRGTNDIYNNNCTAIALVGTPTKPIEQLRASFTVRYGYTPSSTLEKVTRWIETPGGYYPYTDDEFADPLFRDFVYEDIQSTIEQGIGRLRASRRSDEQLTIYLIGDFPHRFPVTLIQKACDITTNACSKTQVLEMAIIKAIKTIQTEQHAHKNKPAHITLTAIAKRIGKSAGHLSRYIRKTLGWKSSEIFIECLQTLLFNTNSKKQYHIQSSSPLHDAPNHLTQDDKAFLNRYISLSYDHLKDLETLVPQVLKDIFDHAKEFGRQCLPRILNALPHNIRQSIIEFFLCLFSPEELEELIT